MALMADPIHVPISAFMQARFRKLAAELAAHEKDVVHARALTNEAATAVVACAHNPQPMFDEGWAIELRETEIVCTPPAAVEPPA